MSNPNDTSALAPDRSASAVRLASIAIVAGGAMWGVFWIPVRLFKDLGLTGAWPSLVVYLGTFILILPFAIAARRSAGAILPLALVGLLMGAAFSLYGTAIILTDVLRAILFFYLTPIWGTIIGVLFLKERLSVARVLAILLALAGLSAVLGFGNRPSLNLGDVLALISGFLWAIGSYKVYTLRRTPAVHLAAAFLGGAVVVTLGLIILGGSAIGARPELPNLPELLLYMILAALFALPMILLTVYPASILTPGRMGILLMSEVVVGIVSVALLSGEPFGLFEALGSALIVSASLVEVLGDRGEHVK